MRTQHVLLLCTALVLVVLQTSASRSTNAASQVTVYPTHPRLIVGGYRGISVAQMQARCADAAFQGQCDLIGGVGNVNVGPGGMLQLYISLCHSVQKTP